MATSTGHQSPASTLNPFKNKTVNTKVWTTSGNTDVVTDEYCYPNSIIEIQNTSAFNGNWYISSQTEGTFTITSTNGETATITTYSYIIL